VDRVGRPPEHVKAPALTIGLAVQPHVISGLAEKPGFRGRGLLGRFLYSLPKSLLGRRDMDAPPVPDHVRSKYYENVNAILKFPLSLDATGELVAQVLTLDSDARAELRRFENWVEPQLMEFGELGGMTDWAGKLVGAVIRIAGLLHMAEMAGVRYPWRPEISGATLISAVAIGKYLIPHAKAAFALMGADQSIQKANCLLRWINHKGVDQFTRRDVHQGLRSQFPSVTDLDSPLSLLVDHGFLRQKPGDKQVAAGRPASPAFDVNPLWTRDSGQKANSEYCEYFESGLGPSPEGVDRGPKKGLE